MEKNQKIDMSCARVKKYTASDVSKAERHNERKNESYENMNVIMERTPFNVHYKTPTAPTYMEQLKQMEADGQVSLRGLRRDDIFKRDIDECIKLAMNESDFYTRMKRKGYVFDVGGKYPKISHPSYDRPRRLKTLGDDYTPERISERVKAAWRQEEVDIPKQDYPAYEMWGRSKPKQYQTMYVQFVTVVSFVKERPNSNRNLYKLLGDEIRKLDRLIEQQNLLCGNDIDTPEQLNAYKENCKAEISELTEARNKLRSMLKSAQRQGDEKEIIELKEDISNLSERLKKLRRDILVCERIEEQQHNIDNKIDKAKESNMKEMRIDEQFRRRR